MNNKISFDNDKIRIDIEDYVGSANVYAWSILVNTLNRSNLIDLEFLSGNLKSVHHQLCNGDIPRQNIAKALSVYCDFAENLIQYEKRKQEHQETNNHDHL
ncbi:hypothetical protein RAK44_003386 [Salmonella enterica]|nr:hypothetical protein [Salmonella enterica]